MSDIMSSIGWGTREEKKAPKPVDNSIKKQDAYLYRDWVYKSKEEALAYRLKDKLRDLRIVGYSSNGGSFISISSLNKENVLKLKHACEEYLHDLEDRQS